VDEYGDLVRWWITLNERCASVQGLADRTVAPGARGLPRAFQVLRRMLRTHVLRTRHSREAQGAMVSIAKHCLAMSRTIATRSTGSRPARAAAVQPALLDALQTGRLALPGQFSRCCPSDARSTSSHQLLHARFVRTRGCAYRAARRPGRSTWSGESASATISAGRSIRRDSGFPPCFPLPVLCSSRERHPAVDEDDRWGFIYLHCGGDARDGGGDEGGGYLYWSLLDNTSWTDGFEAKFGLIGVNSRPRTASCGEPRWLRK